MTFFKKIVLGIAIGAAPLVLAGCYGVSHQPDDGASLLPPPAALDVEPVAGLQTIPREQQ